jgi:hypothetical protein
MTVRILIRNIPEYQIEYMLEQIEEAFEVDAELLDTYEEE